MVNNMKKQLSILALLCLVAISVSGRGFSPTVSWDSGDCTLTLYDDGYLEVYGFHDMRMDDYASDTDCPWYSRRGEIKEIYIKGTVANIGANAFNGCTQLTTVTVGNIVTSIGADAFIACSGLSSVIVGSSVTSIGSYAFSWCSGLTSVTCLAENIPYTDISTFDSSPKHSNALCA